MPETSPEENVTTAAVSETDDATKISGRVSPDTKRRVKVHAARTGKSIQGVLEDALIEYLDRHEAPGSNATEAAGPPKSED